MISVKDAITDSGLQARTLQQARRFSGKCLELGRESLRAVEEHVFPLFPEAARKAQENWRQVYACIREEASEDVLESTPRMVERILHNYALDSRRMQWEQLESVKSILGVMAEAVGATRLQTNTYSESMAEISESLRRMTETESLEELRRQLTKEAAQVRESVAKMVRESEASVRAMESDLAHFRTKLAEAEAEASTDVLTGLANRRELERQMEMRIQRMTPFCVLLFDLDNFKSINERFGHECGDQALRGFAGVLNEQVRPGDVVARWGGDEFFVIFDCTMKDALRRSQQISVKLARRYELNWDGKPISIPLQASSGVVEYCCGETASALFRRADEAMYAVKGKRSAARETR